LLHLVGINSFEYFSNSGFSKKQYVLVSLTESAGCVF